MIVQKARKGLFVTVRLCCQRFADDRRAAAGKMLLAYSKSFR